MPEISRIDLGHVNVRGKIENARFVDGVQDVLGQALPHAANTVSQGDNRIYWLSPDEWHIVTDFSKVASLLQNLEDAVGDQHVAINDLSGGQVALHLTGADVPSLLSKACTLDFDPSVFTVGDCAQCGLAKANVLIGYIDAAPVYEIIVRRSFSEYLLRWLHQNPHSQAALASF